MCVKKDTNKFSIEESNNNILNNTQLRVFIYYSNDKTLYVSHCKKKDRKYN